MLVVCWGARRQARLTPMRHHQTGRAPGFLNFPDICCQYLPVLTGRDCLARPVLVEWWNLVGWSLRMLGACLAG